MREASTTSETATEGHTAGRDPSDLQGLHQETFLTDIMSDEQHFPKQGQGQVSQVSRVPNGRSDTCAQRPCRACLTQLWGFFLLLFISQ